MDRLQKGKCGVRQFLEVSAVGAEGSPAGYTYRFQPLHRLLADVHASGLLHLHVTQVLQTHRQADKQGETPQLP